MQTTHRFVLPVKGLLVFAEGRGVAKIVPSSGEPTRTRQVVVSGGVDLLSALYAPLETELEILN